MSTSNKPTTDVELEVGERDVETDNFECVVERVDVVPSVLAVVCDVVVVAFTVEPDSIGNECEFDMVYRGIDGTSNPVDIAPT